MPALSPETYAKCHEIFSTIRELDRDQWESRLKELSGGDHVIETTVRDLLEEDLSATFLADELTKKCPRCGTSYPHSETRCQYDNATLREPSILTQTVGQEPTGLARETTRLGDTDIVEQIRNIVAEFVITDELPKCFGGRWERLELLGNGAFGDVYRGQHTVIGTEVAIKVLHRRYTSSERGRKLFHQEAMRLSRLNHPNIVKVFDFGEEEGRMYLVMELLKGTPLNERVDPESTHRPLTLQDGLEIARQVTLALEAAHSGRAGMDKIVHLDLKTEHVFVEEIQGHWHVSVIDFGIAEVFAGQASTESGEQHGAVAGTISYMAPERWRGVVDPRCDLYALGVVLYELTAGRKPFLADNARVMRLLHENEPPAPPSRYYQGPKTKLLKRLDQITLGLLEKDPQARPSGKELLERLAPDTGIDVRRIAVAVAAVVMLVLGLFYWAPWENAIVSPLRVELTPDAESGINSSARGYGYRGAVVLLRFPDRPGADAVRLGTTDNRGIWNGRLAWSRLESALGRLEPGQELAATVTLRGTLWRSVTSEPIVIALRRTSFTLDTQESRDSTSDHELDMLIRPPPGRVEIVDGDRVHEAKDAGRNRDDTGKFFRYSLARDSSAPLRSRTLKLRMWSELLKDRGLGAAVEHEIEIRYDLSINPVAEGRNSREYMVRGSGVTPEEKFWWSAELIAVKDAYQSPKMSQEDDGSKLVLDVPKGFPLVDVRIKAVDKYGNRATYAHRIMVESPAVQMHAVLGDLETDSVNILHTKCLLRQAAKVPELTDVKVDVNLPEEYWEWNFKLADTQSGDETPVSPASPPSDGKFAFALGNHMETHGKPPGKYELVLTVRFPGSGHPSVVRPLEVIYEKPLTIMFSQPAGDVSLNDGRLDVTATVSAPQDVTVEFSGPDSVVLGSEGYLLDITVPETGSASVTATAHWKGREYRVKEVTYSRRTTPGTPYIFDVGDTGRTIPLIFVRDSTAATKGFWITPLDAWQQLSVDFGDPDGKPHPHGVPMPVVERVCETLRAKLDRHFAVPKSVQLEQIDAATDDNQWVADPPMRVEFDAAWIKSGKVQGAFRLERAPFRLVVADNEKFRPIHAVSRRQK